MVIYDRARNRKKNILKLRLFEILNKELQEQENPKKLKIYLFEFSRDIPHSLGRKAEISK